jgi:electron transport complex protein RnfG
MSEEVHIAELNIENPVSDEKEPSSAQLILALGLAGLFSGILLVGTYIYTLPKIEANKAAALQTAIFKVLPDCQSFDTYELVAGEIQLVDKEEGQKKGAARKETTPKIFAGFTADGTYIGFAIPAQIPGFQDIIGAIYGYDPKSRTIVGFEVLESKETPGLGDKIFKDADFQTNFKALNTLPEILAVKKGAKVNDNEVEAITGATISSKAVVKLLNVSLDQWREPIDRFMEESGNTIKKEGE